MTPQRAKELLPVIQAFAEGKTIQCNYAKNPNDTWEVALDPCFAEDFNYRIKPESTMRPWTAEEIQIPLLVRPKADDGWITLVVTKSGKNVWLGGASRGISFEELFNEYLYTLDGGKTFLPCGKASNES